MISDQWSVVGGQDQDKNVVPATLQNIKPDNPDIEIRNPKLALERSEGSKIQNPLDLVRRMVAERAELPEEAVQDNSRMLSDLHLNSITVGQLVIEAAGRLGLAPPLSPTDYADATLAEIAQALEEIALLGGAAPAEEDLVPSGVDTWVRTFTVEWVEAAYPVAAKHSAHPQPEPSEWRIIAHEEYTPANRLREAFARLGGRGVVVCLTDGPIEEHVKLLLEGAHAALAEREHTRFVLVQPGGGSASFAKTLHLEAPEITVCVVDAPIEHPQAAEWIANEAAAAHDYVEARYDEAGTRRIPVLRLADIPDDEDGIALGPDDVLLVTGGGKGIAAECALVLARETGVRLALMGRSQPVAGDELSANLDRMSAMGVNYRYFAADVTDPEAVRNVVREIEDEFGPVTALLHGAGANEPQLLGGLDENAMLRTLSPKVGGARNVLEALDPQHLRLFITFGSIIARTGMKGEADYALANERLTQLSEQWQMEHPHCKCLALEWSVWAGVGMGERLHRVQSLQREGISPIPPDEGIAILRRLVGARRPSGAVVVAGRFGEPTTLPIDRPELPFRRFLERPRAYYPGIELVVDTELSATSDPYLADHVFRGEPLLPAVVGLEAMAQVAMALVGAETLPIFQDVALSRPVVVPEHSTVKIRVAAIIRAPGLVEVVLRSEESAFGVDHFRAICLFNEPLDHRPSFASSGLIANTPSKLPLDPERDLYGDILFHSGRFKRLRSYSLLKAKECIADVSPYGQDEFGRYLPQELVLGDFAARDAVIHAVQACIPNASLLPTGVDRLALYEPHTPGAWYVHAIEREHIGDNFTYDIEVTGDDGQLRELWEGLHLRRIEDRMPCRSWPEPLLRPYIERRIEELIPGGNVSVVLERSANGSKRASKSDAAIHRALGNGTHITRRPDGKPETNGKIEVSAAHSGDLTLAAAGTGPLGCDMEPVLSRTEDVWRGLLGAERYELARVVAAPGGDYDTAATRVWAASECLKKAGSANGAPLILSSSSQDGWVVLRSGRLSCATFAGMLREVEGMMVLAVLTGAGNTR